MMTMRMILILRANFVVLKQKSRRNSLKSPRLSRNRIYLYSYPPPTTMKVDEVIGDGV